MFIQRIGVLVTTHYYNFGTIYKVIGRARTKKTGDSAPAEPDLAAGGVPRALLPTPLRALGQPHPLHRARSALNPPPSTLNPQPSTLNPQPSTPNPREIVSFQRSRFADFSSGVW